MQRRLLKPGRDVDEPVAEHGPRHVRETVRVADAPDLLAGLRIVGGRAVGADADQLVAVADADHAAASSTPDPHGCRRDVFQRTFPVRLSSATTNASSLPSQLKISRSPYSDRRPAVAVLRLVGKARLPDDLPGRRSARRCLRRRSARRRGRLRRSAWATRGCSWGWRGRRCARWKTSTFTDFACRLATSKAMARSDAPFSLTDVVSQTRPPATTGDDHPRPGTGVFHTMFRDSLHASGKPASAECPWPDGPAELRPIVGPGDRAGAGDGEQQRQRDATGAHPGLSSGEPRYCECPRAAIGHTVSTRSLRVP